MIAGLTFWIFLIDLIYMRTPDHLKRTVVQNVLLHYILPLVVL